MKKKLFVMKYEPNNRTKDTYKFCPKGLTVCFSLIYSIVSGYKNFRFDSYFNKTTRDLVLLDENIYRTEWINGKLHSPDIEINYSSRTLNGSTCIKNIHFKKLQPLYMLKTFRMIV